MYDWAVALYDPATATPGSTAGPKEEEDIKNVQAKINNLKNKRTHKFVGLGN